MIKSQKDHKTLTSKAELIIKDNSANSAIWARDGLQ